MIEIGNVQEVLYSQVIPVLENKSVDPDSKKKLACKYVYLMADLRSGKKALKDLREQYQEIIVLIEKG